MKYNSELHGQFPYFSGCGMTFVLIIAGTLVPGMPSATIAHPMAAKFMTCVLLYSFIIMVKMEL